MSALTRIRPAALTVHCVGHSGVSTGIGSIHGGRAGDTGLEGAMPSPLPDGQRMNALAKIEMALAMLRIGGLRPSTLRAARAMLDRALGDANRHGNIAFRASIMRMRNWLSAALNRVERAHG